MKTNKKPVTSPDQESLSPGLFGREEEIESIIEFYRANRPTPDDDIEILGIKQERIDSLVNRLLKMYKELVRAEGHISELMVVSKVRLPFMGLPYCEVRPLRGASAELGGTPLNIVGDSRLNNGKIKLGDVVFVSKAGGVPTIVDVEPTYARSGQLCTVLDIHEGKYFNFELEVEDGRLNNQKIYAFKWERLDQAPKKGDKVYVNTGVIYEIASTNGVRGRFAMTPATTLKKSDLRGEEQVQALTYILACFDRYLSGNGNYPARSAMFAGDRIMLCGPQGVGKNHTIAVALSIAANLYTSEKIFYQMLEGAAVFDSLVGASQAKLREMREMAIKAYSEGKLPITHITEAGSVLVSRESSGNFLDSGVTQQVVEQILSMCSGPQEIPGVFILDFNYSDSVSRAMKDRFQIFHYSHISTDVFIDILKSIYEREDDLFEGEWASDHLPAITMALSQQVGAVMIGKEGQVPVTAGNVITGRSAKMAIKYALNLLDQSIYVAHQNSYEPLYNSITPPLLHYSIVHTAHGLFSTWSLNDARTRLVPELIKPEKAGSISHPEPIPWTKIKFASEYDCSSYFAGIGCT